MRRIPRPLWPMVLLAILPAACRAEEDARIDAYRAFAAAVATGDDDTAWHLLSHDTQAELTQEAQAVATARGLPAPQDGRELAFGDAGRSRRAFVSAVVTSVALNSVSLEITDDKGGKQPVELVREQDRWLLDLTAEIAQVRPK